MFFKVFYFTVSLKLTYRARHVDCVSIQLNKKSIN